MTLERVESNFLWCDVLIDVVNFVLQCRVFMQLSIVVKELTPSVKLS